MEDKSIYYEANGKRYKISESEVAEFEKDFPSAQVYLSANGKNYLIGVNEKEEFMKDFADYGVSYTDMGGKQTSAPAIPVAENVEEQTPSTKPTFSFSFPDNHNFIGGKKPETAAKEEDEGPSFMESVLKATGSAAIRTGKRGLNLLQVLSSGYLYNDPETGAAKRTPDIDTQLKDKNDTFTAASILARETADKLSREADPTGGEKGFWDLLADGEYGKALQKGIVTTIESAPNTLAAKNWLTMGLNAAGMAAENYVESTLENPEVEQWKRATMAIGSAAIEQAVEKLADPVFKYVGGKKAAKKLTNKAAKEFTDEAVKEAKRTIAQRIVSVLENTAKDSLGEGTEEIITNFGNDALGEALDAIDGNKDFGVRAQWAKFKEQNPDATLEDFGWAKAEEYADAFIGGFISGGYMSGPVQTIVGAKQYINDQAVKADIENTQAKGASLGVEGMYDTTHKVQDASQQVMDAFTNDKGESPLSLDYINSLSSEEAYALATREGLTKEQRMALGGYAHVKAEYEGLTNKLDSNLEGNINAHKAMIEHVTTDDGKVVVGLYNGSPVYVKGGIEKNGKITTANGQNGPVVVINTVTGEKTSVNSNEITSGSSTNADEYTKLIESQLRENDAATREKWRNTMSDGAKQKDIQQYADSKVLINAGNGMTQVEVQKIMPNGQVLVKGKKGDLGGQSEVLMSASEFYDAIARDENGQPVFVEKLKVDMPVAQSNEKPVISEQPSGPVAVSDEDIDYMEEVVPILVDGKVVNAEVTAQDNTSDSITYRYIDENGNVRVGGSTIGEFIDAKNKADELSKKTVVPEANDTNDTTVEPETPVTPETPETPVINQQPTTAGTAPQEVPVTPQIVNWDALFENDQEAYFGELQNQYGDKAPRMLGAIVSATQKKLDALNKAVPDTDNEILENEAKKDKLEAKIQALNNMLERLNTPTDEVTTEEVAPVETATDATITEEVPETTEDVETPVETVEDIEEVEEVTLAPVEEAAKKPEVTEVPTEVQAAEAKPVAPNPVANPVKAAQEREKPLIKLINRLDVEHELKADTAKRVGKEVADMFATREDYKAYEAVAGSLGDYLDFFDEGVEESFANRKNNGNSQKSKDITKITSTPNRIEDKAVKPTESQREVGKFVIQWLKDAGYTVHTDITELINAIKISEKEKTQFLKTAEGEVYGLMQNGEIYLDMSLLNPNTPIHEYTHIWDAIIMEKNPQLWEDGKKLLKQLPLWNEIANSKRYKRLQGDENLIASEVHSRLVGEKGEAVFTQLYERANGHINEIGVELDLITKIKNWIYQVMDNLKSIIIPYGRDKSVSLQEFIAMPINDLVFNAKPRNRFTETNKLYWGEQPANALSNLSTIAVDNIDKFNSHAQQYYTELKYGIGYVVYEGSVYVFDIDSDGLARPVIESTSYEKARRKIDVFNRINSSGFDTQIRTEGDRTADDIHNNSGNGVRGTSENVSPVAEGESRGDNAIKVGGENSVSKNSVSGSSVDSDGLLFRNSSIDDEMEAIKNEAIANGTFMKAPNGKPTKLNERQWLQVRTQNFLNWFGDWINDPKNASKVVDENGEPRVVYHGSPYGNITEFNRKGHSVSGLREFGTYFGSNRRLAELYAYARQQAKGDIEKYELEKAKIDAIIFNPETPARVALDAFDELDKLNESQKPKVYEVFLNIRNPKEFDAEKNNGYKGWHKLKQDVGYDIKTGVEAVEAIAGHNSAARMSEKYDGIIAHNMADVHHEEGLDELMGDVFLVFDETPSHIKSATNNTGEFSIENPDIRARHGINNDNFVKQFEFKQNNESGQLEYSDEFRELQEESARMSGQLVSEKDGVQQAAIRGLVGGIGRTLQRELDRATSGRGYKLRNVVNESKGTSFDIIENVDGRLFHDIFEIVRAYLPNGELVDLHDNYNDAICYITSDGLAGFAVDKDGNLISVYSLYGKSKKGFLGAIKDLITEAGATHLDGYNSEKQPLAEIYSKVFGWKVASMMDYNMEYDHDNIAENHGMPQVAFMVNTDADIETKHFDKDQYDEAVDYQLEQVEVSKRVDTQNAAIDNLVGEPRTRAIEHAVNKEADKLGIKVTYKTREQMPKGHKNDKGYYNTKTGEIVICTENAASIKDAIQTILHEAVAHKGLRQLMGDKFNEFINRVYESLDAETKAKVDARAAAEYNGDTAVAMEEYMATLAESVDFNKNSVWDKIKSAFESVINAILGRNDIKIGDEQLRYILRASYNNMVNQNGMNTLRGWAQDQMMREEYKINDATETPEILSRTGIDPAEVARMTAARTYDMVVNEGWQEFQRQFQDAYQPVRIAIDAIQAETGDIPIEDYENYILIQNQSSSRSRVEIDNFARKQYTPIIKQINKIIDKLLEARGLDKKAIKDAKRRSQAYQEIIQYLIAKHGIERNKYYQETKTRTLNNYEKKPLLKEAYDDYNAKVSSINEDASLSDAERELQLRDALAEYEAIVSEINTRQIPDIRDYSGLTSLFGLDSKEYEEAEAQAQELVDEFERKLGREDDEESGEMISQSELIESLWKKINAATDKTLRHSYESGLISRQQYNDIKGMFNFYVPLRGFDETTAEDIYSYARFEGNKFNAAVQKAEGRTSLSDDPIATIMNMAESEITQGNKNRAKQALYNYILNRDSANNKRNSLMQLEDVWYVVSTDDNGNKSYQIAAPDHEKGETYEEFEERMKEMEENGEAEKSKKGHVDVGVRFQKQRNKNAHYVYLKINGVDKAIYVNGDPKAADAINGKFHQKPMFGEEATRAANRVLSSMFTNYSLEFTARNYFRDLLYSHINIGVRESDPEYRVQFRKNWRKNNLGSMIKMLNAYKNGEFDGRELTDIETAFVEFMENGGQTGYTIVNSVENHKKDLQKAIERMQEGIEKGGIKDSTAFKYTLGAIELLNESSELITRFAAYKTSRDMGRGVITAINDAKEVTVNFNTKGAQDGAGWMGFIARYFGATKFFFNASVQGVQNIAAMAKANKLKFGSVVGGVVATGFFMPILTQLVLEVLGADDDEAYWNIPEYERQNNLCIVVGGGKYVKIPLPIGFREMYAIGDMVAAMAMDKRFTRDVAQVGMDIANKVSSVVLPINPLEGSVNGLSLWYNIGNTIMPSAGQFILQNMNNVDWKGAPLQKEYTYNENDPSWMKAFESNPDWMKGLSKWCNEHINLDGDYKGLNWSPEKLDNTLSNLGGGIYSLIKKSGNTISMIWNEEKRNLINVPLAGVALGSGIDNDERFVTDAYFDMKDFYDSNIGYIKRRAEKFGYDLNDVFYSKAGEHHPKMQDIYNNRNFNFMQEWYAGNKELESLNNEIKNLKKNLGGEENMTEVNFEALTGIQNELNNRRREFVNKMLEIE